MSGPRLSDPHHDPNGYEPERGGPPFEAIEEMVAHLRQQRAGLQNSRVPLSGSVPSGGTPPPAIHPNCRSTTIEIEAKGTPPIEKVQEAVDKMSKELAERSKDLLKR